MFGAGPVRGDPVVTSALGGRSTSARTDGDLVLAAPLTDADPQRSPAPPEGLWRVGG